MNASAEQIEPVATILPLSPRWEEEKAPLPPPTTRLMLNLRLKALRERLGVLERQHAENVAALDRREAEVEVYVEELEAQKKGRPRLVPKPEPKAHRRPGPIFEGASWMAEHGLDWLAEGRTARDELYPDVDEETWASVEAARELGAEVVAKLDPVPGAKRRRQPEPEPAPEVVQPVEPTGQLPLFAADHPTIAPALTLAPAPPPTKPRRQTRERVYWRGMPKPAPSRVPPCQAALLEAPTGPPRYLRVNLLRTA